MQQSNTNQLLGQALNAFNHGQLAMAEGLCRQVLSVEPKSPDSLYLLATILRQQNKPAEAEAAYKKALEAAPKRPATLVGLANLYMQSGRYRDALSQFKAVLALAPNEPDNHYNVALAHQRLEEHAAAVSHLEQAVAKVANRPNYWNALGMSQKNTGDQTAALSSFDKALALEPGNLKALHNKATLLKEQQQLSEAETLFKKALAVNGKAVEPRYVLGNLYYETGAFDDADVQYRTVLSVDPTFREAHRSLNKMYWEHDKKDLYTKSYQILSPQQLTPDLCLDHVQALVNSGRLEEADFTVDKYLQQFTGDFGLLVQKGQSKEGQGDLEQAKTLYQQASDAGRAAEEQLQSAVALSRAHIKLHQFEQALPPLDRAKELFPHNQEIWSQIGICWRYLDEGKYRWLLNFEDFIEPAFIETPEGYDSREHFLSDLNNTVDALHTTLIEPVDQTLRGGSQTHNKLLERPEPAIVALKSGLEKQVAAFIARLPDDEDHPFLQRKTGNFNFSASWSVKLKADGFHVNHVHALGWISSSFYTLLPDSIVEDDQSKAGWIKFGESAFSLGEGDTAERWVRPQEGMLALFPSYCWHGTEPFTEGEARMTTPFDVVPA